jgi:hypothetical protein
MNVPLPTGCIRHRLGLAFGGAALAGAAIDPTDGKKPVVADAGHGGGEAAAGEGTHGGERASMGSALSGLAVSRDGFTLEADRTSFSGEGPKRFTFRVVDDRGRVVRDEYELESERELHLEVARRDTAIYEHVHPRKSEDGTTAGRYRLFFQFKTGGEVRTVAYTLEVPR